MSWPPVVSLSISIKLRPQLDVEMIVKTVCGTQQVLGKVSPLFRFPHRWLPCYARTVLSCVFGVQQQRRIIHISYVSTIMVCSQPNGEIKNYFLNLRNEVTQDIDSETKPRDRNHFQGWRKESWKNEDRSLLTSRRMPKVKGSRTVSFFKQEQHTNQWEILPRK